MENNVIYKYQFFFLLQVASAITLQWKGGGLGVGVGKCTRPQPFFFFFFWKKGNATKRGPHHLIPHYYHCIIFVVFLCVKILSIYPTQRALFSTYSFTLTQHTTYITVFFFLIFSPSAPFFIPASVILILSCLLLCFRSSFWPWPATQVSFFFSACKANLCFSCWKLHLVL